MFYRGKRRESSYSMCHITVVKDITYFMGKIAVESDRMIVLHSYCENRSVGFCGLL